MVNKFTFKEHKPSGRYRSFYQSYWDIKLKKKICGHIHETRDGDAVFTITLSVKREKTEEDPCSFRNAKLKAKFKTIYITKKFLEENTEAIIKQFDLHLT